MQCTRGPASPWTARWTRALASAAALAGTAAGIPAPLGAHGPAASAPARAEGADRAAAAQLTYSATALTFRSTAGTPAPAEQRITVANVGSTRADGLAVGAVTYGPGQPTGWLSAVRLLSAVPAGQSTQIVVDASPGALPQGVYTASFAVTSTNASPASQTVTVRFEVAGPTLAVAPRAVSFASTAAVPAPPADSVDATNAGSTQLTGLRLSPVTYGPGATGWLEAAVGRSTLLAGQRTPVALRALPGKLAAGTYRASFTVRSDNAANDAQAVDVTFDVLGPRIGLASTSAALASTGATPNPGRTVALTNTGSTILMGLRTGTVAYGAGQPTGWLSATLAASGQFGPGAGTTVALNTNAAPLAAGTYTATVPLLADNAPAAALAVTLTVEGARVALEPAALAFDDHTTERTLLVRNTGSSNLSGLTVGAVTYTSGATGWLTAVVRAGQAFPVHAGGTGGVTVRVNPAAVPAGTHTARFSVAGANAGNGPLTAEVTYTRGDARVVVNPAALTITAGGLSAFGVQVTNGGAGVVSGLRVDSVTYAAGEPRGWLAATLGGTATPAAMTVATTLGALGPGRYRGTVWVGAPGHAAPAPLAVEYVVPRAEIAYGPSSKQWTVDTGTVATEPATFAITSRTVSALTGLAVERVTYATPARGAGWLTATLAAPNAPTTLTVRAAPGALAPGNHFAYVVLASPAAAKPDSVTVLVTVLARPRIVLRANDHATEHDRIILVADAGGADPAPHAAAVQNGAGGTLDRLAVGPVTYPEGQPAGWVRASLAGTTAPTHLSVGAALAGLAPGVYTARVPVTAPGATNSGEALRVQLTVRAAPALVLSPAAVTRTVFAGDPSPAEERVNVGSGNGAPLVNLAVGKVTYAGPAAGWLQTRTERIQDTQYSLFVAPNAAGLAPGEYVATVPVTADNAAAPQALTYTLRVTARATIALSPDAVVLTAVNSGTSSAAVYVDVSAGGPTPLAAPTLGAVEYLTPGASGWLSLNVASTGSAAGPVARVTLQGFPSGLANGEYRARVPVLSEGAANSPQHVAVRFFVGPAPALAAAPGAVSFDAAAGGASPAARAVAVTNAGVGALEDVAVDAVAYSGGQPAGWLAASLDRSTAPATLTLTPTLGTLPAGTYTASVRLRSAVAANSPLVVPVTLRVAAGAAIALAPGAVRFEAAADAADPAPRPVAVTNAGGGALAGLAVDAVAYAAGQPTGWLTAALSGPAAPATLTLAPTLRPAQRLASAGPGAAAVAAGLPPGTYTATVTVRAPDAEPRGVVVTLVVAPAAPGIALSAEQVLISAQTSSPSTRSARLTVTPANAAALAGLTAAVAGYGDGQPVGWLTPVLSGAATPATLTLRASSYRLPMGVYGATATVAAGGAVGPREVAVALEVVDLRLALAALGTPDRLPAAVRAWLDARGNKNGGYDLGDYQALRARVSAP